MEVSEKRIEEIIHSYQPDRRYALAILQDMQREFQYVPREGMEALAEELLGAGANLLTLGDHTWGQRGFDAEIGGLKRVVRPANYPEGTPGLLADGLHVQYADYEIAPHAAGMPGVTITYDQMKGFWTPYAVKIWR